MRVIVKIATVCVLSLFLSGCVTGRKDAAKPQIQQLQSRITQLEQQLEQRDGEITNLEDMLEENQKAQSYSTKKSKPTESSSKPSIKDIQIALKNAGYYAGPVDGKAGEKTKKAIESFQKTSDLTPDGVAGQKTWAKLKKYLDR
ncbi:MAG: peptidoglycan-binding protein [Candidatus Omnitrophica bacterium]|nr:peptidoglycan-binding protein [Candidatus Omnitrophota bacterium]